MQRYPLNIVYNCSKCYSVRVSGFERIGAQKKNAKLLMEFFVKRGKKELTKKFAIAVPLAAFRLIDGEIKKQTKKVGDD